MTSPKTSLTFKDWKSLKGSNNNSDEKLEHKNNRKLNVQPNNGNKQFSNNNADRINYNKNSTGYDAMNYSMRGNYGPVNHRFNNINEQPTNSYNHFPNDSKNRINYNRNLTGSSHPSISDILFRFSGRAGFPQSNYGAMNHSMRGNYEPVNQRFNNTVSNFFNRTNTFDCNNAYKQFQDSSASNKFINPNELQNNFGTDNFVRNCNTFDQFDNFFASDGIYRQKDLMQKPLPNPFRYADKDNNLLQQFDKERYSKNYKKNKNAKRKQTKISSKDDQQNFAADTKLNSREPEVYITNPKAKTGGKPFIPKPKFPEENFEISREERKQQWKEYRQAMKPFKNRDFHNAKRVLQRFAKIPHSELTEKQLFRLKNAEEYVAEYKARLNAKYPNYVKTEDCSNELGELYVLKTVPLDQSFVKASNEQHCNYNNENKS